MARVIDSVGRTALARAQLVGVLAGRSRFDDARAVWASLSPEERRAHAAAGDTLARALYANGQYRRALQVISETGAEGMAEGQFSNRSFEADIGPAGHNLFQWDVVQAAGAQVAVDARAARGGQRSLRVVFNASGQVDFRNVSQLVAVEPGARYRLSFWLKTDGLKSAAMPLVLVTEAGTDAPLASSPSAPTGTADWQQVSVEFAAGQRTEALVVRLARAACPDGVCPIFGKIWYDDFNLERAGGRANAGR
jgi:hypothetical protein